IISQTARHKNLTHFFSIYLRHIPFFHDAPDHQWSLRISDNSDPANVTHIGHPILRFLIQLLIASLVVVPREIANTRGRKKTWTSSIVCGPRGSYYNVKPIAGGKYEG